MLKRFFATLFRALADHFGGDIDDERLVGRPGDLIALAVRVGRVEGRQSLQLAIESTILVLLLGAAIPYILASL